MDEISTIKRPHAWREARRPTCSRHPQDLVAHGEYHEGTNEVPKLATVQRSGKTELSDVERPATPPQQQY